MKLRQRTEGMDCKGLPSAAPYFWEGVSTVGHEGGQREGKEDRDRSQLSCDLYSRSKGGGNKAAQARLTSEWEANSANWLSFASFSHMKRARDEGRVEEEGEQGVRGIVKMCVCFDLCALCYCDGSSKNSIKGRIVCVGCKAIFL